MQKSADQKFWIDSEKDKNGNFERDYSRSNH